MIPTAPFATVTLAVQVYEHLLRQISTGELLPGQPLRELELVTQLGVSRTPIREALLRLSEYGLVEGEGRSAQVRRLSAADVVHLYQVRRALEGEATRLACGRLTPDDFARLDAADPAGLAPDDPAFEGACYRFDRELHSLIAGRSGNPLLVSEVERLFARTKLLHKPVALLRGWLALDLAQHRQIVAALRADDRRACRRAVTEHLRSACRVAVQCVAATPKVAATG